MKRFIPAYCLQMRDKFVPFWELKFIKNDDCGEGFSYDGQTFFNNLIPCYWDTQDKKIILGKVKDYYPNEEHISFKVGEMILFDISYNRVLTEDVIEKIVFEEYDVTIKKVSDMEEYELNWHFTKDEQKELKLTDIYEIRCWKPYYLLKSGKMIKYDHQLYRKQ